MADHYYSVAGASEVFGKRTDKIIVGTSATGANPIELRITDGVMRRDQVYVFCRWLSQLVGSSDDKFTSNTPFLS